MEEIEVVNNTGEALPEWLQTAIENTAKPAPPNRHMRRYMARYERKEEVYDGRGHVRPKYPQAQPKKQTGPKVSDGRIILPAVSGPPSVEES